MATKVFKLPDLGESAHEGRTTPPPCKGGGGGVGGAHEAPLAHDPESVVKSHEQAQSNDSTHPLAPSLKGRGERLHRIRPAQRKRAAEMRSDPTQPERILWSLLRKSQLGGLKFRRQATIGPYIVDFCCPSISLVVEVDGESHVGRAAADAQRTRMIESHGYRVLRVTNDDVLRNLEAVGLAILNAAGVDVGAPTQDPRLDPPPGPLPFREGESTP